ncbi:MAG: hypothetical protein OES46_11205 [Gammaproteobacteria bacterium]|nr:hypothetical protein [Gammaproteobacteria bacterium]
MQRTQRWHNCAVGVVFLTGLGGMDAVLAASDQTAGQRIGRYSLAVPKASRAQADLLSAVVTVRFPHTVTTVGQAIDHLLKRSGYRLASMDASDPGMAILVTRPLPVVHRRLGPITVAEALEVLAGPAFRLVVDHLNRLVSYEVTERYRALAAASMTEGKRRGYSSVAHPNGVDPRSAVPAARPIKVSAQLPQTRPTTIAKQNARPPWVYGPIKANETLRHIAGQLQPSGVTKEQMMIALLARNPRAFDGNNINQLRQGAILIEPPPALFAKISRAAAVAEVRRHMIQWRRQNQ